MKEKAFPTTSLKGINVALVHDYIKEYGGAERVLETLAEMFPNAPIYAAFCVPGSSFAGKLRSKKIIVSWANRLLRWKDMHSPFRFLIPYIWESFDFRGYDIVINSASGYMPEGIVTRPETMHVVYCHTPARWLYGYQVSIGFGRFLPVKIYGAIVGAVLRVYDFLAAQRVDYFIANSENVRQRIKKFYHRDAAVIYPPVEVTAIERATKDAKPEDFYLIVSRIVGHKGLDLAIEAANQLKVPLKIIGEAVGFRREKGRLQNLSGETVEFLGRLSDEEMWRYLGRCKAFLALETEPDFGVTPVEAMAAGRPVIAFAGGGYLESVVDRQTGVFFHKPTTRSLVEAMRRLNMTKIEPDGCRRQAEKFSKERFVREMSQLVQTKWEEYRQGWNRKNRY
jgi:glycosyltransferase involved in cell wall biosynthesis